MNNQKLTIVAKVIAKEEKRDLVRNELIKLIKATKAEKGCINYDLHQDINNKNIFLFHENWENRELWKKHVENTHMSQFTEATEGAIAESDILEMIQL